MRNVIPALRYIRCWRQKLCVDVFVYFCCTYMWNVGELCQVARTLEMRKTQIFLRNWFFSFQENTQKCKIRIKKKMWWWGETVFMYNQQKYVWNTESFDSIICFELWEMRYELLSTTTAIKRCRSSQNQHRVSGKLSIFTIFTISPLGACYKAYDNINFYVGCIWSLYTSKKWWLLSKIAICTIFP